MCYVSCYEISKAMQQQHTRGDAQFVKPAFSGAYLRHREAILRDLWFGVAVVIAILAGNCWVASRVYSDTLTYHVYSDCGQSYTNP